MKKNWILLLLFIFCLFGCKERETPPSYIDDVAPIITFSGMKEITIDAVENYDLLQGVTGTDNIEGDITQKIKISSDGFDSMKTGTYHITYTLRDSSGNNAEPLERTITVINIADAKLVAHRGGKFGALENTKEAFQIAADMGFYGIECDIQETSDGVLVVSHDTNMNRLAGVDKFIKDLTWDELKEMELTKQETDGKTYTGHICLFSEYLDIIKNSHSVAFIELKETCTKKVVEDAYQMIQEKGLTENQYVFIANSSGIDLLIYLRGKSSHMQLQFVARTNYQDYMAKCFRYGIDLDIANTCFDINGYEEATRYLQEFKDGYQSVNIWVVNSTEELKKFLLLGADYITTDSLVPTNTLS